jgi:hypothetical protein
MCTLCGEVVGNTFTEIVVHTYLDGRQVITLPFNIILEVAALVLLFTEHYQHYQDLQLYTLLNLVYKHSVRILIWEIGSSQSLYLHKTTQIQEKKNINIDAPSRFQAHNASVRCPH